LPGNPEDSQARYIEAAANGVLIASLYLPNGNPQPGPKFDYKLASFERPIQHGADLMKASVPVVLAGDHNVVTTVEDIYPESPGVPPPVGSGLDGRSAKTATRGTALDILGLRA